VLGGRGAVRALKSCTPYSCRAQTHTTLPVAGAVRSVAAQHPKHTLPFLGVRLGPCVTVQEFQNQRVGKLSKRRALMLLTRKTEAHRQ